jgi:transposase-like protein
LTRGVSQEVKEEILSKIKSGEAVSTLAKQYGISDKTIYNWLGGKTTKKVTWLDYAKLKRENQQLKEIIGVLSLEVEKSKKRQFLAK